MQNSGFVLTERGLSSRLPAPQVEGRYIDAVTARFTLRSGSALWSAGNTAISALSTSVLADMDNGSSLDAEKKKLADKLAIDTS